MLVLSLNRHIDNSLTKLLTPSWLSLMVAITTTIIIVFGGIGLLHYRGSYVQLFYDAKRHQPQSLDTTSYEEITTKITANTFVSDIPLFILWAGVGYIAYTFSTALFRAFRSVYELKEEMDYVNINQRTLVTEAAEHVAIRVLALIVWIILMRLTIHVALPYVLVVTYAGFSAGNLILGGGYVLLAMIITALCCHIYTILLRLVLLRPRVFAQ